MHIYISEKEQLNMQIGKHGIMGILIHIINTASLMHLHSCKHVVLLRAPFNS